MASTASAQEPVALIAGWEYAPDAADGGLAAGWATGEAPDAAWTAVAIPHVFDARPLPGLFAGTVGWYRITFNAPTDAEGWALRFGSVRRVAQVWLNGIELGTHRDPYVPFEMGATGLRPGEPNTLVVRVDNRKGVEPKEGWWNWGGIVRPVSLVARGATSLQGVGLLPRYRCAAGACGWSVLLDGELAGHADGPQELTIAVALRAPDGAISQLEAPVAPVAVGERRRVRLEVPITGHPALWAPEHPALYAASVELRAGGIVRQVEHERVGLRTVSVREDHLQLNGRPLNLRGASLHEDLPGLGAALDDAGIERIIADLKAVNANVTRAHYVLDERLLDRFDEEGILVWNQAPIYHRDRALRDQAGRFGALATVRGTVLTARNHPSVIVHSVANELSPRPDDIPGTRRFLQAAARLTRDLDPTRPVALDIFCYPGYPRQRTYDAFDAIGVNGYYGWYQGKRGHSTADEAGLTPFLKTMHERHPGQALVLTEFGAEAARSGLPSAKGTFEYQAGYLRRTLRAVDRLAFMSGAIYWTLREFAIKPRWSGGDRWLGDPFHSKGLLNYDGTPKPAWHDARGLFGRTPLYRR